MEEESKRERETERKPTSVHFCWHFISILNTYGVFASHSAKAFVYVSFFSLSFILLDFKQSFNCIIALKLHAYAVMLMFVVKVCSFSTPTAHTHTHKIARSFHFIIHWVLCKVELFHLYTMNSKHKQWL